MSLSLADKQKGFISCRIKKLHYKRVHNKTNMIQNYRWVKRTVAKKSCHTRSALFHTAAYPGFRSIKHLGVMLSSGWVGNPTPVSYHLTYPPLPHKHFVRLRWQFIGTHLYSWMEKKLWDYPGRNWKTHWPHRRTITFLSYSTFPSFPLLMSVNRVWWKSPIFWLKRHEVRWHRALLQFNKRCSCLSKMRFKSAAQL